MATIDRHLEVMTVAPDEGAEILDEAARRYLGMSGAEFARAWEGGEFDGDPDRPEVMRVAALLPLAG